MQLCDKDTHVFNIVNSLINLFLKYFHVVRLGNKKPDRITTIGQTKLLYEVTVSYG